MLQPMVDAPDEREDLRRLIARLEALVATDARKAPVARELLAKLTPHLTPPPRRRPGSPSV